MKMAVRNIAAVGILIGLSLSSCRTPETSKGSGNRRNPGSNGRGNSPPSPDGGGCTNCKTGSGERPENVDNELLNQIDQAANNGQSQPPAESGIGSHGGGSKERPLVEPDSKPEVSKTNHSVTIKICEECFNSPNSGLLHHDHAVKPLLKAELKKAGIEPQFDNTGGPGQLDVFVNGKLVYSRFFREGSKAKSLGYDDRDDDRTSNPTFIAEFVEDYIRKLDGKK